MRARVTVRVRMRVRVRVRVRERERIRVGVRVSVRARMRLRLRGLSRAWKAESGHSHCSVVVPASAPRPILRTTCDVSSERSNNFSRDRSGKVASHCIMCCRSVEVRYLYRARVWG